MKSKGNGTVPQCVSNLLKIVRGEIPYDRLKGIDPTLIDRPSAIANPMLVADAKWLIDTYEPRANLTDAKMEALLADEGDFALVTNAEITE
ncbi:MAG: early E1A protein [bacterium]|nr:early E1A protein [bacterium]